MIDRAYLVQGIKTYVGVPIAIAVVLGVLYLVRDTIPSILMVGAFICALAFVTRFFKEIVTLALVVVFLLTFVGMAVFFIGKL